MILRKGLRSSIEFFSGLSKDQWNQVVYLDSGWTPRSILVHLISAEIELLRLLRITAEGGAGIGNEFNLHEFNLKEQNRFPGESKEELISELSAARLETIDWVCSLNDDLLDRTGRHPALGIISIEAMLNAIWGHHIQHQREMRVLLR
jgi:hypothetical protein